DLDDMVVVSELGFAKKARNFAEILGAPLAIVEKRRVGNEDKTELMNIIGEVEGKNAVSIDDEIDTAGSIIEAVAEAGATGAERSWAASSDSPRRPATSPRSWGPRWPSSRSGAWATRTRPS